MLSLKNHLPSFIVATWVMSSVVIAIAYALCRGTAEAVMMAHRITKKERAVLSGGLHPHYRETVQTHARFAGFEVAAVAPDADGSEALQIDKDVSAVVVQNPDFFGRVRDYSALAEACHAAGALLVVVVTEVVSLGAITPPGEMGADIVVGSSQRFGVPMGFGGPHAAFFATRDAYKRHMPGRLVGV